MSIPGKVFIKSHSLPLHINPDNATTSDLNFYRYTINGYIAQYNTSNRTVSSKSFMKHKILSLFKLISKEKKLNIYESVDSSIPNPTPGDAAENSTFSSTKIIVELPIEELKKVHKKLDSLDKHIITQFSLHRHTMIIIDYITEQPCSVIRLPRRITDNSDNNLTNKALQPFLATIPGLVGIKNHRNSCYVNVVVQCLSCIDSVAEYFSTKDYLADLHIKAEDTNIEPAVDRVTDLDVLISLSYLLQSLWQLTYKPNISFKFYQLLSFHQRQFSIDSQQDAHELLLCMLNLLHENLVREDPLVKGRNSSFIFDRFRGWLTNTITCPKCRYSHMCTDQMLSLNLQIPQKCPTERIETTDRIFSIIVSNGNQIARKHAFDTDKMTTLRDIRSIIADRMSCLPSDIVVMELLQYGFGRLYSDNELIYDIAQNNNYLSSNNEDHFEDGLYAIHIPNQIVDVDTISVHSLDETNSLSKKTTEVLDNPSFIRLLVVHVEKTKFCSMEYMSQISDELRQTLSFDTQNSDLKSLDARLSFNPKHYVRFSNILSVQAATKTKLSLLRHSLSEQMCKYLNLRNITKLPKPQFIIEGSHLISELDNYPLLHSSVTMALKQSADICGEDSTFVRLVVLWPYRTTEILRFNKRALRQNIRENLSLSLNSHKILLHRSFDEMAIKRNSVISESHVEASKNDQELTIYDCLKEFFSLDSHSVTESWNCPSCQTTQDAETKIRIKESPEILIVMLKRFSNEINPKKNTERLNSNVNLLKQDSTKNINDYLNKLECLVEYPLENLDMTSYMENSTGDENYLYSLQAVVNHNGNLSNGHYVAMCKNPIDNQWRLYDDDRITEISKIDVVHRDAYILFYKRQSFVHGDLSPEPNLHWSYRRLLFPDIMHRNQSPNPTNLYSKYIRNPDRMSSSSTAKITGRRRLSLTVANNHNSKVAIISPHLSSSSSSSSSNDSSLTVVTPGNIT